MDEISISHFSHEHPLIILKQVPTGLIDDPKIECNACRKPLSKEEEGNVYGCSKFCKSFFLHKSCAQLEIVHKSHEQHSLFLITPKEDDRTRCDLCGEKINGAFYRCNLCPFNLHRECAFKDNMKNVLIDVSKDLILKHDDHEHPLTLLPRSASFLCNACDVKDEDFSYKCSPCRYWIHRRCALLPSKKKREDHSHPLNLCFRLPSRYYSFEYDCDVCKKKLDKYQGIWLYYCNLCRYFVHIKCMDTHKPPQVASEHAVELLSLPETYIIGKVIQQFLLKVDSPPDKVEPEIQIFSHKHRLKVCNVHFTEDDIDDNDAEEILCDACIQPINPPDRIQPFNHPYYCCAQCKYFLHPSCGKLASSKMFLFLYHSHPLTLGCKEQIYDMFRCSRCKDISNGFYFSCGLKGCEFFLDLKCAALPFLIVHETHGHPLLNIPDREKRICNGCEQDIHPFEVSYRCSYCHFYLHLGCVMLPKTVLHRHDIKHPLALRFPPHEYHPGHFDCYDCEKEINPRYWLYHCDECDLSFHTYCIPRRQTYPGVKCGQRIQISYHTHPLQFVRRARVNNSACHRCKKKMEECLAFECETCNFRLCQLCVLHIETEDSRT